MRKPENWPLSRVVTHGATLASYALAAGEKFMPEVVRAIPWDWLAIAMTIFSAGFLLADITNEQSWIRRWLRWKFRLFDVDDVIPVDIVDGNRQLIFVTVVMRFIRDAPKASLGLKVEGCFRQGVPAQSEFLVINRDRTILTGEILKLCVATIPTEDSLSGGAHWNVPSAQYKPKLVAGSVNVAQIQLRSGRRSQTYKVYVRMPTNRPQFPPYFFMGEDHDAFKTAQGPVSP